MNRQLVLSSHTVKTQNGNKPSDFTIKYSNPYFTIKYSNP